MPQKQVARRPNWEKKLFLLTDFIGLNIYYQVNY